jgi:hypothetical protein
MLSHVVWKPGDSQFWDGLMATKKTLFFFGSFSIKDGSHIRFWEDKWLENTTLRQQYPALYNVGRHKGDTIATVMASSPPSLSFRKDLIVPRLAAWNALLQRFPTVQLSYGADDFCLNLNDNDVLSRFFIQNTYST